MIWVKKAVKIKSDFMKLTTVLNWWIHKNDWVKCIRFGQFIKKANHEIGNISWIPKKKLNWRGSQSDDSIIYQCALQKDVWWKVFGELWGRSRNGARSVIG